jgi:transcriptional regulator with GAF, ATPase, and Fis domain
LFIDEIGDMPLEVQVKLLRALQEHSIERLGGAESIPVDIRLIAATHRPLEDMMREGVFREDLFYRLNVVPIVVPPLRERKSDILPLAGQYLAEVQRRWRKSGIRLSDGMLLALESYAWPGNVRELINVVERAVALTESNEVAHITDFATATSAPVRNLTTPPPDPSGPIEVPRSTLERVNSNLKDAVNDYERRLIVEALANAAGNRTKAARELGISRQALAVKLAKFGLH